MSDEENGRIVLSIKKSDITGGFMDRRIGSSRASSNTNFTIWEDLKTYTYNGEVNIKETLMI